MRMNLSRRRGFGAMPTRRNFAVGVPNPNTYEGELALPYMSAAIGAGDNLANGWVRELTGIVSKATVPTLNATASILEGSACDFDSNDTISVADRQITLTDLHVNEEICRGTLYPTWHGASSGRAETDSLRSEFGQFAVATVAAKVAEVVDKAIWSGGAFPGFLSDNGTVDSTQFALGTIGTNCVDATIGTITAANAIGEIGKVYNQAATTIPAVLSKADVAIYVGPATFALYLQALSTAGAASNAGAGYNSGVTNQNYGEVTYLGVPVRRCLGIPANVVVLSYRDNFVVGNNNGTDLSTVQYIPTYLYDGSDNIRIVMRMALGTMCVTPTDVVVGTVAGVAT